MRIRAQPTRRSSGSSRSWNRGRPPLHDREARSPGVVDEHEAEAEPVHVVSERARDVVDEEGRSRGSDGRAAGHGAARRLRERLRHRPSLGAGQEVEVLEVHVGELEDRDPGCVPALRSEVRAGLEEHPRHVGRVRAERARERAPRRGLDLGPRLEEHPRRLRRPGLGHRWAEEPEQERDPVAVAGPGQLRLPAQEALELLDLSPLQGPERDLERPVRHDSISGVIPNDTS